MAADYPTYGSDAFAALAGITPDALTQPDPDDEDGEDERPDTEDGNADDDWDPRGLDGDRDGDASVRLSNGGLPNNRGIVRAFDLEDFAVSPVATVEFVPVQVQEK